MSYQRGAWLSPPKDPRKPTTSLVCFPHTSEVVGPECPVSDIDTITRGAMETIAGRPPGELVIVRRCGDALPEYETAFRLVPDGGRQPNGLIMSGQSSRRAPRRSEVVRNSLPHTEVVRYLRTTGGLVLHVFLLANRTKFQIVDDYVFDVARQPLPIPIVALACDANVALAEVARWDELTSAGLNDPAVLHEQTRIDDCAELVSEIEFRDARATPYQLRKPMRVVVTGHEGYIGTVLVPQLRAAGHDVVGLDNGYFADCTLGPFTDVEGRRIDLRDVTPEDMSSADAVIHLAALSNDPLGDLDPATTYDVNLHSTMRLARAARDAGVRRFLFSSSCSLYGAGATLLHEASEVAPLTHYAESKLRAEESLRELADARFSPVFLRNATAYGYSPRLRTDLVVNDLTAQAVLTGEIALRSDGAAWRPLAHVDDISAAFVAMLSAPTPIIHGQAFNVGRTDENYRVRDIARIVAGVVAGSRVSLSDQASPDSRDYRVSCDRIATGVPDFRPTWSVRQGVEQLAEAYRRHALRLDDAIGPRFRRLTRIRELTQSGRLDDQFRWTEASRLSTSAEMAPAQGKCWEDTALRSSR